jgi:hypothetical protein
MTHDELDDEFLDVRDAAAQLPVLRPSRDLWDGIAARIETPTIALPTAPTAVVAPRRAWMAPSRLVAAAALLMAVTAGVTWQVATREQAAPSIEVATNDIVLPAATVVATPVVRVTGAYEQEIAELRTILAETDLALDPATVAVVDENLRVIDAAIAAARAALDQDPASALLSQRLAGAYDMKLDLLRRLTAMRTIS